MPSVKLSIKIRENKSSILVNECTGQYSSDNKNGWGGPNWDLSMVTKAQFEVYPPEAVNPIIVNVFPDFPTNDPSLAYELLLSQIGVDNIESGVWKIGYRVSGIDSKEIEFEKYTETRGVFTKTAECCIDKLRAATANIPSNVFMKDEKKRAAVELGALFEDALWAKDCGNFDIAQRSLKFINLQCQCCT